MVIDEGIRPLLDIFEDFHAKDVKKIIFKPLVRNKTAEITLEDIEERLKNGQYSDNYWKLIEDVNRVFKFIQENFSSRTAVYQQSVQYEEQFNIKMDEIMKKEGYCCSKIYTVKSMRLTCSQNSRCNIKSYTGYYRLKSLIYCEKCFEKLSEENMMLNEMHVKKADFIYGVYIQEENENFIECKRCKKLMHERCVMHLKSSGIPYYCEPCSNTLQIVGKFSVSSEFIPRSECDVYIENFLRKHNIPGIEDIVIRMVSNVSTTFRPKKVITKYWTDKFDNGIMYNNGTIFAFSKSADRSEICFFGLYFQLFSLKNCPEPNKSSVYLSYIDSVKLCTIKDRTKLYQFILLGLFEYLKTKNFSKIFIWSCPPRKNVDYIFNGKPAEMKIPNMQRLSQWYRSLAQKALAMKIIDRFTGIKEYATDENWADIKNIPYFDSDLWPIRLEEAIIASEATVNKVSINDPELKAKIQNLMDIQINGFDDQYFVLHFCSKNESTKPEIPDIIDGNFTGNRGELVDTFWEYKLEYSNERHAKFSTLNLIYRILMDNLICINCLKTACFGLNINLLCGSCMDLLNTRQSDKRRISKEEQPSTSQQKIKVRNNKENVENSLFEDFETIDLTKNVPYTQFIDLTVNYQYKPIKLSENEIIDLCD